MPLWEWGNGVWKGFLVTLSFPIQGRLKAKSFTHHNYCGRGEEDNTTAESLWRWSQCNTVSKRFHMKDSKCAQKKRTRNMSRHFLLLPPEGNICHSFLLQSKGSLSLLLILTVRDVKVKQIPPKPFRESPRKISGERTRKTNQKHSEDMGSDSNKGLCYKCIDEKHERRNESSALLEIIDRIIES